MSNEEYTENLEDFSDSISLEDLPTVSEAVNVRMQRLIDSQFTQSDSKKKA